MKSGLYKASTSNYPSSESRTYMFYYDGKNWYQHFQDRYGRGWVKLVKPWRPPVYKAALSKMSRLEFLIRTGEAFQAPHVV